MIELEQHYANNLEADASVQTLNNIDPLDVCLLADDEHSVERCIFLNEHFVNFGWGDSVTFLGKNQFIIKLITEIPIQYMQTVLTNANNAWLRFEQHNVKVLASNSEIEVFNNILLCQQVYRIQILNNGDYAHLQLYSIPKVCRYDGEIYPDRSIMTFHIYRTMEIREQMPEQPLLTVQPYEQQTFCPLVPGQRLQLITSLQSKINTSNLKSLQLCGSYYKTLFNRDVIKVTNLMCKKVLHHNSEVVFIHDKGRISSVIIPAVQSNNGELFFKFVEPVQRGGIFCAHMAGFILLSSVTDCEWFCDGVAATINSCDESNETAVTFTKGQRYVTLDKIDDIWWLANAPELELDRLRNL